ncbi:cobyrinate a,c-diamide synthase [Phormidesmis priestleyi ULC007]|uniref:Cobyrinate a,c-diamide synthase n=2 Tax=Phormidesmis priestleyi TaxID=268141 RepID=A0A2T1D810_9CYAN|nr:cobyrinate a,c-diamide synthase [Phormidesmis priestleyi]PSB16639.1 cobyrinate a,c-diamide synthase [Phormidesmis priestleyi ULC007]PZO47541.1 MAG: cobyrinate a,c-diamide synthase [Phormidesmis priestleyi]
MGMIIAGERSGVGKTTVTLALLSALQRRSQAVQSFKVGPDYIDPMFHRHVTKRACRNLDPVLTSEAYVQQCFAQHSQTADYALIEGVMGLFDGASGSDDFGSTAHIARLLNLPVLLILNCSSLARSIAAIAHGYRSFDPRVNVAGVVLNRVGSDRHLELLTAALEPLNLPILGVLRRQDEITIPDRHLGLVPTAELENLNPLLDRLADLGETCFDWSQLLPLLKCQPLEKSESKIQVLNSKVRVAIAYDSAFNFYYADNLDLLEQLGAELVYWSPLTDSALPERVRGLYFGGGFPEVFAAELAANQSARQAVDAAIQSNMPTYAECGGLMYLCEQIIDFAGQSHSMVGILPTTAKMGKKLTLGYRQATVMQNSPMMNKGDRVWGHEFHRSTLTHESDQPLFNLEGYHSSIPLKSEGWQCYQLHASYTHLHFGTQPEFLKRFLHQCSQFEGH